MPKLLYKSLCLSDCRLVRKVPFLVNVVILVVYLGLVDRKTAEMDLSGVRYTFDEKVIII